MAASAAKDSGTQLAKLQESSIYLNQVKHVVGALDSIERRLSDLSRSYVNEVQQAVYKTDYPATEKASMNVKEKASRRFYTKEQENIANIKQKICDAAIEVEKVDTGGRAADMQAKQLLIHRCGTLLMRLQELQEVCSVMH